MMFGNKLILSAAVTLAVTISNPVFAQRLTGCLTDKGAIINVQQGDTPIIACDSKQTQIGWDQKSRPPVIVVDSSVPPKVVGPSLQLDLFAGKITVGFNFEGQTFRFLLWQNTPDTQRFLPSNTLYFSGSNCQGQAYATLTDLQGPSLPPLKLAFLNPTATGHVLWVEDGTPIGTVAVSSHIAEVLVIDAPSRHECVESATSITNAVPLRDTGINLNVDFTPPFRFANLPTRP